LHLPACRSLGAGRALFEQPGKDNFFRSLPVNRIWLFFDSFPDPTQDLRQSQAPLALRVLYVDLKKKSIRKKRLP
jgi:hypothetical protein